MVLDKANINTETDLLLPQGNYKSFPKKTKREYYQIAYYIYLFILRKMKIVWENFLKNMCCCCCCYLSTQTPKTQHICYFPKINIEVNYDLEEPNNLIFWGEMNHEEVFFTEQEQLAINYMKERIKKSN